METPYPREHLVQVQVGDNQFDFVRVFEKQIVWASSRPVPVGGKVFIEVGKLVLCGVMCDSRDYHDGSEDNDDKDEGAADGGDGADGDEGADGDDDDGGDADDGDQQVTPPDTAEENTDEDNSSLSSGLEDEEHQFEDDAGSRTPPLKRAREDHNQTPPLSSSSSDEGGGMKEDDDRDDEKEDDEERNTKGGSTSPPSVRQWQPAIVKMAGAAVDVDMNDSMVIGDNGTRVPVSVLREANWDNYRKCVRVLMRAVFSREYIANHTLSGKPAPVNMRKTEHVPKEALDPAKMADIMQCVQRITEVNESDLRASITGFCADELKGLRKREKRAMERNALSKTM